MRRGLFWLGIAISAVSLYWVVRGMDMAEVGGALASTNLGLLALTMVPFVVFMGVKVVRWGVLFYPATHLRHSKLLSALMIGYLFNVVLPARLGEVARAYVIGGTEKVSVVRAGSTILVEKVLDVLALALILFVLLPFVDMPRWMRSSGMTAAALFLALFCALLAAATQRGLVVRLASRLAQPLPEKLRSTLLVQLDHGLDGLSVLTHWRVGLKAGGLTLLCWALTTLFYYGAALAVGLQVPYTVGVLMMVALNLSMTVPSSPGYVGVLQFVTVELLRVVAPTETPAMALSYSVVTHLAGFLPVTLAGAYALWREGLSLAAIQTSAARPAIE